MPLTRKELNNILRGWRIWDIPAEVEQHFARLENMGHSRRAERRIA